MTEALKETTLASCGSHQSRNNSVSSLSQLLAKLFGFLAQLFTDETSSDVNNEGEKSRSSLSVMAKLVLVIFALILAVLGLFSTTYYYKSKSEDQEKKLAKQTERLRDAEHDTLKRYHKDCLKRQCSYAQLTFHGCTDAIRGDADWPTGGNIPVSEIKGVIESHLVNLRNHLKPILAVENANHTHLPDEYREQHSKLINPLNRFQDTVIPDLYSDLGKPDFNHIVFKDKLLRMLSELNQALLDAEPPEEQSK